MSHAICRYTRRMAQAFCGRLLRMRTIYKFFVVVIIVFWLVMVAFQALSEYKQKAIQQCYRKNNLFNKVTVYRLQLLEDVSLADRQPTKDNTIFFHEISCSSSGMVEMTARQACAIESAARSHPHHDIFVLFASPVGVPREGQTEIPSNPIVESVRRLPNVYLRNVNMWTYARDTPIDEWLNEAYPDIFAYKHFKENMGDFMRFLSLYKYGGICMNQDVVVRKSLAPLGTNYVGLDRLETMLTAVMSLSHDGNGHSVAEILLREFAKSFQTRTVLKGHGEDTINYVLRILCNTITDNRDSSSRNRCSGINLLEQSNFYPIREEDWRMLFDGNVADFVEEAVSGSYTVHFWERQSSERRLKRAEEGKKPSARINDAHEMAGYSKMAEKFCPGAYAERGAYF